MNAIEKFDVINGKIEDGDMMGVKEGLGDFLKTLHEEVKEQKELDRIWNKLKNED